MDNFNPFNYMSKANLATGVHDDRTFMMALLAIVALIIIYMWVSKSNKREGFMAPGVIDQLFAKDAQDTYINSNINNLASADFELYWNNPSRITDVLPNRGALVLPENQVAVGVPTGLLSPSPSATPDGGASQITSANGGKIADSPYASVTEIAKPIGAIINENLNANIPTPSCSQDMAGCGNGSGGYRLNKDIVNPIITSLAPEYVNLNGTVVYQDMYVPDFYMLPNNDVNYPYAYMPKSNVV
jgi:hypothetical protein